MTGRRLVLLLALALVVIGGAWRTIETWRLERRLVATDPDTVPTDPALVRLAGTLARPAYAANCAACHGTDLGGSRDKGAPDLVDAVWLYDTGQVSDIERTILHGIRSGDAKGRNVTDMPALGLTRKLTPEEIRDVAAYVGSLAHQPADGDAVARGRKIYQDKGVCYDCHGADGSGNQDWGAPAFGGAWLYGGDAATVYHSIYYGRHGLCPAWNGRLSPVVIRALAVWIHAASHPQTGAP